MTPERIEQLRRIARAADALEGTLHHNTGDTADWPYRIVTDNTEDAQRLVALLQELRDALTPYRQR